jgi:hypothetical protein
MYISIYLYLYEYEYKYISGNGLVKVTKSFILFNVNSSVGKNLKQKVQHVPEVESGTFGRGAT